ncbi:MAG: UDP-N-acetylglucosamine 1-carboxyvinyltransferase [Candidatus Falkowbacteria bacterium]
MSKYLITGGRPLSGTISVKGAKNAGLKIIPATLLSAEPITITNLPAIEDIDRSLELIQDLGCRVERSTHECVIHPASQIKTELNSALSNKLRASIMFVGPLLARFGEAKFPHPGGCVIGAGTRPIDIFLEGFEAMGAKLAIEDKFYKLSSARLHGTDYFFPKVSVTGTEALLMTAILADGQTILRNCAMEPEIVALADYLNTVGARISGAGSPTITIQGVEHIGAGTFQVIPDRIEAGTFAILAAAAKAKLIITDCRPDHLGSLLALFRRIGVPYETTADSLTILPADKLKAESVKTHEYPGFPTDLQSPYTVLMTQAEGMSLIHETIYDRRLLFTDMLTQMGADIIMCDPHRAVINGPTILHGRHLTSPDLRAGISMIIAGLIAQGHTEIDNIYQIDRGYENIDERLRSIGADIERID